MIILVIGLLAFIGLHLYPVFGANSRAGLIERLGKLPYRGIFSVLTLTSLGLVIWGWRQSDIDLLYSPPTWGYHVTPLFVLIAFILFIASNAPTNIKRLVRHPQLLSIIAWGTGHLFANGEVRSILLFGGFAIWAIVAIIGSNRRDGEWVKPEPQPILKDIITIILAVALYAGFIAIHEWLIGVSPIPL
jgi:uncharacterized membrane protein